MSAKKQADRYEELKQSLTSLPFISPAQVEQWVSLQQTIDNSRDYLIRAVPDAQFNIDEAQRILAQRTYTLVFFGGTGVGKSTLINALMGRNLLPTGAVTAVTGTIVYIEQAMDGEAESLTLNFWSKDEFAARVRRLCQLAEIDGFDITNAGERDQARADIATIQEESRQEAKTERDEYLEILIDCLDTYENHRELFKAGTPPPQVYDLNDQNALAHLREDGHKGNGNRQIRIIRSATFKVRPRAGQPNLLMDGHLRIVDVPGLGAGMRLHEAITLEEMKREDAMIVLVTDAGRQRVDEMKALAAVNWIKENRLHGLKGADLDEAAAKIFLVVNGANVRQAFDRLNAGLPASEAEIKAVTRHIAPNYWERYRDRGHNRPYFLVMAPPALYVQDPEHAPAEFASETERVLKVFKDQLGNVGDDPLEPETAKALLALSELPLLRDQLLQFIKSERVRSQLREAATRVRAAIQNLRFYYEKQLAARGMQPPFDYSWESLQERRYENVLIRQQKELPRIFHKALLDMSAQTNSDERFHDLVRPTLNGVQGLIEDAIQREVETLLESYGTEYWDDRDVTYDNLVWGTSGIEVPIKRILFQVELIMQEALANSMPQLADIVVAELERTLVAHDILARLGRASYGQEYSFTLPESAAPQPLSSAYRQLIERIGARYREICRQATMYEMVKPERSINYRLEEGERELALPSNERLLDVALHGVATVRRELAAQAPAPAAAGETATAVASPDEDEVTINILDEPAQPDFAINLLGEATAAGAAAAELERSYADKLDSIAGKTNRIFRNIVAELFSDDELLARLRRLFWLEATRLERDVNNHIIKPMLRQHDRNLHDESLRQAMSIDLDSVSELEELMRIWDGLDRLEASVVTI